jgi:hypothetical protein
VLLNSDIDTVMKNKERLAGFLFVSAPPTWKIIKNKKENSALGPSIQHDIVVDY